MERLAVAAEGGATVISANDYLEMARECMALSIEAGTAAVEVRVRVNWEIN